MAEQRRGEESSFGGRVRRYARVGTSVGGLAARVAGNRLFGGNAGYRGLCRRSQGGPRRPEGAGHEGGPDSGHGARPAAAGIRRRTVAASDQRAVHGLGLRQAPHGRRTGGRLAAALRRVRARGRRRGVARPGPSRHRPRRKAAGLQAAVSRTWPRRWKPTFSSSSWGCRCSSATTASSTAARSTRNCRRGCARSWTTAARPPTCGCSARCWPARRPCTCRSRWRTFPPTGC